uniref:Vascular cell adhesion protein 1-like isoform X1 n=2 Tax=Pogona vitticeps TaxID=103695 RepID=A0A6J0VJW5_9SAUR
MTAVLLLLNGVGLLSFWLSVAWACNVTIHPENPAVMFGGPVDLNCTTSCTNYTGLNWEVSLEAKIQEGNGWISLAMKNVEEWKAQPLCWVKYEDSLLLSTRAVLYVYEFSTPTIQLASEIQQGHSENIVCNIPRLKVRDSTSPHRNISLSRGPDVLSSNNNKSSLEYSFVADLQKDDRTEIICEASVQVGSEVLRKQTRRVLNVVASPFNVSISANRERYKTNENIKVTCNATGKPFPEFSWHLPSTEGVEFSDNNRTIEISSAQSSHNGTYLCLANNIYGKKSARVDIVFEESTHSWIAAVVVVTLLAVLITAGVVLYRCQK